MALPLPRPLPPMEATTAEALPDGGPWLFEPKWDGFRCVVFRDGADVELQSKARKSLTRYFPEVAEAVRALRPRAFALDGELVVPSEGGLSFDALLQRVHPAESRVERLSRETPALLLVFDLLATGPKTSLLDAPLERRRPRLESWAERYLEEGRGSVRLSPATRERSEAEAWLRKLHGVDGVVAKVLDAPYRSGQRDGMVKVKRFRTADCVVGGFRRSSKGAGVGSLLLGLYDDEGLLHHVGFTSGLTDEARAETLELLEPRIEPPGFTGRAPGGPSRWSRDGRSEAWEPLRPELVVEVGFDHVSGGRFRHGTRFERWRPDKAPEQCTMEQIAPARGDALRLLAASGTG